MADPKSLRPAPPILLGAATMLSLSLVDPLPIPKKSGERGLHHRGSMGVGGVPARSMASPAWSSRSSR